MNRQKIDHIGDCHKCPATGVQIPYGWKTRDNQHCHGCNNTRIRNRRGLQAKNFIRKSYRKGGQRKSPQRPLKRQVRKIMPKTVKNIQPTKSHKENLAEDKRVNAEIWKERTHECLECGKEIKKETKRNFSHVHSKGARPDLRHEKENIAIHCYCCHDQWEGGDRNSMPRTLQLFIRIGVEYPDNRYNRK